MELATSIIEEKKRRTCDIPMINKSLPRISSNKNATSAGVLSSAAPDNHQHINCAKTTVLTSKEFRSNRHRAIRIYRCHLAGKVHSEWASSSESKAKEGG
jgi:hypothetical protein